MSEDIFLKAHKEYGKRNYEKAFKLFMECAESGDFDAMSQIAIMYTCGEGVDCDYDKAIAWEAKAIACGSKTAMLNLGVIYRIKGDLLQSRRCLEKALEGGDGEAALLLAKLYMISDIEVDTVKKYLSIVIESDDVCEASLEEAEMLLKNQKTRTPTNLL